MCLSLYSSQKSNDFIKNVKTASFVAIDEEMSGIQLPPSMSTQWAKDEAPAERYKGFKQVSERYSIIQLGICLFEKVSDSSVPPKSKFHVVCSLFHRPAKFPPSCGNTVCYLFSCLLPSSAVISSPCFLLRTLASREK